MLVQIRSLVVLTKDIEKSAQLFQDLYECHPLPIQEIKELGCLHTICPFQNTMVEFLQPFTANSSLAPVLDQRGEGPYGLVMESDDFDSDVSHLKEEGASVLEEQDMGDFKIAEVHHESFLGVNIQLAQPRKPGTWPVPRPGWEAVRRPSGIIKDLLQTIVLVRDRPAASQLVNRYFGLQRVNTSVHNNLLMDFHPIVYNGSFNSLLALGEPQVPGGPHARWMAKKGQGLYGFEFLVFNMNRVMDRMNTAGIQPYRGGQPIRGSDLHDLSAAWFHPRDTGGILARLMEPEGENPYPWLPVGVPKSIR